MEILKGSFILFEEHGIEQTGFVLDNDKGKLFIQPEDDWNPIVERMITDKDIHPL